jgi:hypothetical protein
MNSKVQEGKQYKLDVYLQRSMYLKLDMNLSPIYADYIAEITVNKIMGDT